MGKLKIALSTPVIVWLGASLLLAAAPDRQGQPGRQVKVAAIAIGCGGNHEAKLKLAIEHLETAGSRGVDIACLPEEFAGFAGESIPGPTTKAIGELARKYHMYVICPIREQAGGRQYNTAVLLDRQGKVAGRYRKVFVYLGREGEPWRRGRRRVRYRFWANRHAHLLRRQFRRGLAGGRAQRGGNRLLAERLRGRHAA